MNQLVKVLASREEMTPTDVIEWIKDVASTCYDDPMCYEDVLLDEFGLEPDYLFDFIEIAEQ